MKVFQRLAHAFKAEGVDATFGMMGDGNMFWLHEMHKLGIKVHEVRHEGAGLYPCLRLSRMILLTNLADHG